jgi:hypothetical protein
MFHWSKRANDFLKISGDVMTNNFYSAYQTKYIAACRAVSGQRLGKYVPRATDTKATIE